MKKVILALATLVATSSALAAPVEYKFVGQDSGSATQLCVIAAEDGIAATRVAAKEMGVNFRNFSSTMTCNGLGLKSFVRSIEKMTTLEEIQIVEARKVKMVTTVSNITESTTCIKAAKEGFNMAQRAYIGDASGITCNGLSIKSFARKYKKVDIL